MRIHSANRKRLAAVRRQQQEARDRRDDNDVELAKAMADAMGAYERGETVSIEDVLKEYGLN